MGEDQVGLRLHELDAEALHEAHAGALLEPAVQLTWQFTTDTHLRCACLLLLAPLCLPLSAVLCQIGNGDRLAQAIKISAFICTSCVAASRFPLCPPMSFIRSFTASPRFGEQPRSASAKLRSHADVCCSVLLRKHCSL